MSRHWSSRTQHLSTTRTGRIQFRGPSDPGQVRSLWLVLHGYGQLAIDFLDRLGAVDDGTRLLVAPEALSRFYDASAPLQSHAEAAVGASWMTREDRLEEIEDSMAWLDRVHAEVRRSVTDAPLTVLGFSQGATAASRWVARSTVPVARLLCWGAGVAPELPVGAGTPLARTPCTIVIGTRDRFVSGERVEAERQRLTAAGHPARFVAFECGHRLDDATLRALAAET